MTQLQNRGSNKPLTLEDLAQHLKEGTLEWVEPTTQDWEDFERWELRYNVARRALDVIETEGIRREWFWGISGYDFTDAEVVGPTGSWAIKEEN